VFSAVVIVLAALTPPIIIPAVVVGAVGVAFGAVVLLVAGQPPTLNPGDSFTVQTAPGTPNYQTIVATPPAVTVTMTPNAVVLPGNSSTDPTPPATKP